MNHSILVKNNLGKVIGRGTAGTFRHVGIIFVLTRLHTINNKLQNSIIKLHLDVAETICQIVALSKKEDFLIAIVPPHQDISIDVDFDADPYIPIVKKGDICLTTSCGPTRQTGEFENFSESNEFKDVPQQLLGTIHQVCITHGILEYSQTNALTHGSSGSFVKLGENVNKYTKIGKQYPVGIVLGGHDQDIGGQFLTTLTSMSEFLKVYMKFKKQNNHSIPYCLPIDYSPSGCYIKLNNKIQFLIYLGPGKSRGKVSICGKWCSLTDLVYTCLSTELGLYLVKNELNQIPQSAVYDLDIIKLMRISPLNATKRYLEGKLTALSTCKSQNDKAETTPIDEILDQPENCARHVYEIADANLTGYPMSPLIRTESLKVQGILKPILGAADIVGLEGIAVYIDSFYIGPTKGGNHMAVSAPYFMELISPHFFEESCKKHKHPHLAK